MRPPTANGCSRSARRCHRLALGVGVRRHSVGVAPPHARGARARPADDREPRAGLDRPLEAGAAARAGYLAAIAVVGLFWFGLYNIALNAAERRVDAGTASMLVNIGPILIAVLAGLALHEGFPRRLFAGCAVALAGVVVIGTATSDQGVAASWGAVLCLAAAVFYAIGVVVQKPVLVRVSPLMLTWLACTFGAVVCLPFAFTLGQQLPDAPASSIGWMVYLAIGPMAIGFLTWGYALARTTAGRMGSITYLVPPIAIVLGSLLLGETPPGLAIVGGAICLAGVVVARRQPANAASDRRAD